MAQLLVGPTGDPEINAVLSEVLSGARDVLGDDFVGMHLDGSLAMGGFAVKLGVRPASG